jgi:polar amino acid transport system substrate-binding protein
VQQSDHGGNAHAANETRVDRPAAAIIRALSGLAAIAVACALAPGAASAQVTPPKRIADQGKIIYCTDLSYPPWEMVDPKTLQPAGIDIEIAAAVAKAMGVGSEHKNITFDGLIPAIQAGQCDAIISTLIDKPARREVLDFVDYAMQGNAVIVPASSTLFVNALSDLSGKKVVVQSGTTVEEDLNKANDQIKSAGKPEMQIVALPNNVDAMQQLNAGLVDAYYGVPEQEVYFNTQRPGSVKLGSPTLGARPVGIATAKSDPELHAAIDAAFKAIRASGEYHAIFEKAGVQTLEIQ